MPRSPRSLYQISWLKFYLQFSSIPHMLHILSHPQLFLSVITSINLTELLKDWNQKTTVKKQFRMCTMCSMVILTHLTPNSQPFTSKSFQHLLTLNLSPIASLLILRVFIFRNACAPWQIYSAKRHLHSKKSFSHDKILTWIFFSCLPLNLLCGVSSTV